MLETVLDEQWLAEQISGITTRLSPLLPSEWAETRRYLPAQVSPSPGYYRFEQFPYLKEIINCFSQESPVREIVLMKGVQVGATTLLENVIGYVIDHIRNAPAMLVTAESQLAASRMESYIIPMLHHSGLYDLLQSADEKNSRKTGNTAKKIEWVGGGWLTPAGANNPALFRSLSYMYMLRDEVDGFPEMCGRDGPPMDISFDRTASFEASRKVFDTSTPSIEGASNIAKRFKLGDQRYYHCRCLKCGFPQRLRWRWESTETGVVSGIAWEMENGELVPESVRYLCVNCQAEHFNHDKPKLFTWDNAEWIPTAKPLHKDFRSYHLSALYSPVGFQTWEEQVRKYLEAYEPTGKVKDHGKAQVFQNNVRGRPWKVTGEKLRLEHLSPHRREYKRGSIPNRFAVAHCESPILLLVTTVDVHAKNLKVGVWGYTKRRRAFVIDYFTFEGDTSDLEDITTWGALRSLIEEKEYTADDGKKYRVGQSITLIDSSAFTDTVYEFCNEYENSVYPIKGREAPVKGAAVREFSDFQTKFGTKGFTITVDLYKDRWSSALRRRWDGSGIQNAGHFNAPSDITDTELKELTIETKMVKIDKATGKHVGHTWHRPPGSKNELWDLLVYSNAALDLIAWDICRGQLELQAVDWIAFWDLLEDNQIYFDAA